MTNKHKKGISTFSAQITATISVALVLLLLGIVSMLGIAANSITTEIKENMGFNIVFSDNASPDQINRLKSQYTSSNKISSVRFLSAEDAMEDWKAETGEDLMKTLGVNPFSAELEVKVKSDYASTDSINAIIAPLKGVQFVSDINPHNEMVDSVNDNIQSIAFILTIVAATLLFISFALINNTVRLTVFSRRFIIHTMKLVGASASFIRKPFILTNISSGIVAGLIADVILAGALFYFHSVDPSVAAAIPWEMAAFVFTGIVVLGIIICALAAIIATNKYLRLSYDDMFK